MTVRKMPVPGSSKRTIYCSINAQPDNLGDIEIRSVFVEWLRKSGHSMVVFTGTMPRSYIDAFALPDTVEQIASRGMFQLRLAVDAVRGRTIIAFAPGPQSFGPTAASLTKTCINLINASMVKATGGFVVGAGRALRGRGRSARALERSFVRRFDLYTVRDVVSAGQLGMQLEESPDLAFAHRGDGSATKDTVLISLRSDRPVKRELLDKVVAASQAAGLQVSFITQVKRDDAQHDNLAREFGVRAVLWGDRSHADQLEVLHKEYATARFVVSNRLHALILGIQHLAAPVALLDPRFDKLSATLPQWVDIIPINSDSEDVGAFQGSLENRPSVDRLRSQRDIAEAELRKLERRIVGLLASADGRVS